MRLLIHNIRLGLVLLILVSAIGGCSKMDDTYKQFLEGGMKVYIGMVDSVFVYPGNNRIQLGWLPPSDSKVVKARVYWNNQRDSVDVPITRSEAGNDTVKVMFNDFVEGTYVFEIYTFDDQGRRSLKKEVVTRVYGDIWKRTLLSRPIDRHLADDQDVMRITWGAPPYPTVHGTELIYEDLDGEIQTAFIPYDELITYIPNFLTPQIVQMRTVYLPEPLAIDTFYTEYTSQRLKGRPIELPKDGWEVETSSFDDRAGNNYRPGTNAIDNNPTTIWVNKTSAPYNVYPHEITVDMGMVHENVEGFAIITRVGDPAARPKTVELYTSLDGDNWTLHVTVDLENSGEKQFIDIGDPVSAQYFKMIARSAYSGNNIALAEIGVFTR